MRNTTATGYMSTQSECTSQTKYFINRVNIHTIFEYIGIIVSRLSPDQMNTIFWLQGLIADLQGEHIRLRIQLEDENFKPK